jgi:hypothetical protein
MERVYSNELRHLLPEIRIGFITDQRRYLGQEHPVIFEDEVVHRARLSGTSVTRSLGLTPGVKRGN